MVSRLAKAVAAQAVTPPKWLPQNVHYEVIMGSYAYGITTDTSDEDVYGWVIPPLDNIFPHLAGHIEGFGPAPNRFENYQQHHVMIGDQEYDFSFFSVVKYLDLVMQNNPNMIDSLFVPLNCITFITPTAQIIRDARRSFLHAGAFHRFKGYAYSSLHKVANRTTKVKKVFEKYGLTSMYSLEDIREEINTRDKRIL